MNHTHPDTRKTWRALCKTGDLVANSGVVALLDGRQIALFYLPHTAQQVFAVDNQDPLSRANVIGRGLLGQLAGELVIASPLYKQHFRLSDGECLEDPRLRLEVWPVRVHEAWVEIGLLAPQPEHSAPPLSTAG